MLGRPRPGAGGGHVSDVLDEAR
ncbi:hypothetical protein E2C01_081620 [Portunus trituberculatus]|uniref:Uncharacterized protein n=1 Tax=Portunus trituberculatus TaxID=210409 RepID=A0A5B7J2S7_PORTR|nr:hypothetical protein [Portunus trituberculatus]